MTANLGINSNNTPILKNFIHKISKINAKFHFSYLIYSDISSSFIISGNIMTIYMHYTSMINISQFSTIQTRLSDLSKSDYNFDTHILILKKIVLQTTSISTKFKHIP